MAKQTIMQMIKIRRGENEAHNICISLRRNVVKTMKFLDSTKWREAQLLWLWERIWVFQRFVDGQYDHKGNRHCQASFSPQQCFSSFLILRIFFVFSYPSILDFPFDPTLSTVNCIVPKHEKTHCNAVFRCHLYKKIVWSFQFFLLFAFNPFVVELTNSNALWNHT